MQLREDRILSLLGIARKAGKLFAGYDLSVETIKSGNAFLAFAAADISEKTFQNLSFEARRRQIQAIRLQSSQAAFGKACGVRAGVGVLTDEGFAKAVLDRVDDLQKEECGI